MTTNLFKSLLHNIGIVMLSLALAYLGTIIDSLLGLPTLSSKLAAVVGVILLLLGFLLRLWAVVHFYNHRMRVISLEPQGSLVTAGPYRYFRNPLYLGANVFCFFGAGLLLGSPTALIMTAVHLPFVNLIIRREERQLEQKFGERFRAYKKRVRRWV
ncbi:MAG TPA: isoprenylcysteine carboxylmethyltransferase family protein [Pyrinomonadaceae bacterium]|nr:isoprenylcysteine carboxylmethyltransferase family protein [Pyrinomonadaceae bacterium]